MASPRKLRTTLEPAFDGPLIQNKFVKATMYIKKTKSQRNAIGPLYRQLDIETTTLCFVETDNIIYKLVNNPVTTSTVDSDWAPLSLASSALAPVGNWNADNTSPVLQDSGAAGKTGQFYFVTGAPTATLVTHPGLFGGNPTTVSDGMYIVSVGTAWIPVSSATTWDSMAKPSVITDYVNGTVIAHNHEMAQINGLIAALDAKYDVSDTADHTIDFNLVPDKAIVEVEFLRQWYYTKTDIEQLIEDLEDGGITTFTGLLDTPDTYVGQANKLVRVNVLANALEFVDPGSLFWSVSSNTTLTADVSIVGGFRTTFTPSADKAGLNVGSVATSPNVLTTTVGDLWHNSTTDSYMGRTAIGGNIMFTYISSKVNNAIPFFSTLATQSPIFEQTNQFTFTGSTNTLFAQNAIFNTIVQNANITVSTAYSSTSLAQTFTRSSGTNIFTSLGITPTYNFTGSYTGTAVIGIDYNPTITALPGATADIAFRAVTGRLVLGSLGVLSATRIQAAGLSGGSIITGYNSSGSTQRFVFPEAGGMTVGDGTSNTSMIYTQADGLKLHLRGISLNGQTPSAQRVFGVNEISTSSGDQTLIFSYGSHTLTSGTRSVYNMAAGQVSPTSGNATFIVQNVNGNFAPTGTTSGGTYTTIGITSDYNFTVGASTVYGIDYNPTLTSTTGVTHIAFRNTSGQVVFGNSTAASNTQVTIDRSNPILYNNILRLQSSGTQLWNFSAAGAAIHTATSTITSGTFAAYSSVTTFTVSSGTGEVIGISISNNYNTTSTYVGKATGFKYNATRTSVIGLTELAFQSDGGQIFLATNSGGTVTSNTRLDVRGISSGTIARFATDANVNVMTIANDGLVTVNPTMADDAIRHIVGTTTNGFAHTINGTSSSNILRGYSNGTIAFEITANSAPSASGLLSNRDNGWLMRNVAGDTAVLSVLELATFTVANSINPTNSTSRAVLKSAIDFIASGTSVPDISFIKYTGDWTHSSTGTTSVFRLLHLAPVINATAGTLTAYGIDYIPSLTSMTGVVHIAARFASGNIAFFAPTPSFGSGDGVMYLGNRTAAPSGNPTDGTLIYSEDITASSVLHIRNEAGDIIRMLAAGGWGTPTGALTRTTFDSGTVTLPQLAERVAGLITDLKTIQQLLKA